MADKRLINVVVTKSEEKGLYVNSAKSFTMVFSKASQIPTCNINVHGKILEQVHSFVYLGSQFTSDARCEKEIRRRIMIAKSAFTSMSKVLTSRDIHMTVCIKVLRCYVWSTLLYGCETWTISVAMQKKIKAFETWLYRRMLRISWKDMVTNEEMYPRMNIKQSLLVDIVCRQMSFLGHVLRKEMEHLVVTGFVDGKRAHRSQRETFLTYLGKFTNKPPMELLQLAMDRVVWSKLCAE